MELELYAVELNGLYVHTKIEFTDTYGIHRMVLDAYSIKHNSAGSVTIQYKHPNPYYKPGSWQNKYDILSCAVKMDQLVKVTVPEKKE